MTTSIFPLHVIRYVVAYVFLSAGILKLLLTDFLLATFIQLGMPYPAFTLVCVGIVEVVCGSLILFNMCVRQAAIPLFILMVGAICLTKISTLVESGVFVFAFDAKLDIAMILLLSALWKENKI